MLTQTTTAAKADHTIWLHADKGATVPSEMKAGETVEFSSKDGEVKIQFTDGWPFEGTKHDIDGSEICTLKEGDKAKFQCQIKPPGGAYLPAYYGGEMQPRKGT
jgi:hypothetical protein